MQVTLKKASEYARLAVEAANKIEVRTNISVSIFSLSTPQSQVEAARREVYEAIEQIASLQAAAAVIRAALARANVDSGVSALLAKMAGNDAMMKRYRQIIGETDEDTATRRLLAATGSAVSAEDIDYAALDGRIAAMRKAAEQPGDRLRGVETNVSLSVLDRASREQITETIAKLRRENSGISDDITALNFGRKISLDPDTVDVLKRHRII